VGALEPIQLAFELVEPTGNTILQARYLTYLAVAHRQCDKWRKPVAASAAHCGWH